MVWRFLFLLIYGCAATRFGTLNLLLHEPATVRQVLAADIKTDMVTLVQAMHPNVSYSNSDVHVRRFRTLRGIEPFDDSGSQRRRLVEGTANTIPDPPHLVAELFLVTDALPQTSYTEITMLVDRIQENRTAALPRLAALSPVIESPICQTEDGVWTLIRVSPFFPMSGVSAAEAQVAMALFVVFFASVPVGLIIVCWFARRPIGAILDPQGPRDSFEIPNPKILFQPAENKFIVVSPLYRASQIFRKKKEAVAISKVERKAVSIRTVYIDLELDLDTDLV